MSFVFVDIETTGLDEAVDAILELGVVVTDDDLNEVAGRTWFFKHDNLTELREKSPPRVREMHDKSGLWRACAEEGLLKEIVEVEAIKLLMDQQVLGLPMTGNTIWFDRKFLRQHLATFERTFFYRSIDISTLTELARFWRPEVYTNRPHAEDKDKPHRAYLDIQHSIAQLKYYRQEFLR